MVGLGFDWLWRILFLFLILIVVVIVAINPVQRINEAQGRANQALVHTVSTSVQTCISAEKAKGANNELIFSVEKCANPAYLVQSKYSTQAIPETIKISANTTNSKICVYTNSSLSASQAATNSTLVSWDSDREIISQPGEGTTVCN